MRHRLSILGLASSILFAADVLGAAPPTPAPTPAAKKKLGGGNFGLPPAPTPAGGSPDVSLAGAARKTQEEAAAPASKPSRRIVITNESLGKAEPSAGGASISITGSAGSKPVVKTRATPTPSDSNASGPMPAYRDASGQTEAEWRERASAAREKVDATQAALDAASAEARRLENDFYAWSDGNYRERVIRPAWDQAKARVKALEEGLERAKAAISDLEDEARKSGAPPGWLR